MPLPAFALLLIVSTGSEFADLRDTYVAAYKPLWTASAAAWWEANTTGSDAAFARKTEIEKKINDLHADRETFARIKALSDSGRVTDPLEARQLSVMYRAYLGAQGDPAIQKRMIELQNEVEQTFNTHRSRVGDKEMTENDVRETLSKSRDSAAAEAAWMGYMAVGAKVDANLRELVKLRNEIAGQLGFKNYFSMALAQQEIDETELMKLLDELETLNHAAFTSMKTELDAARAKHFGIDASQLRPWHFGDLFFQEAPPSPDVNFDDIYAKADILALTRAYYAGLGLGCDDILERSDLYEKPGKSPHAFCADLNREGDIRVLCNIKPNLYWADTVLHEVGHGVYAKYIRRDLPWLLHDSSHAITDEGMAMVFGAMALNEEWLTKMVKLDPTAAAKASQAARSVNRAQKLIFSQWAQVVVRFEHGMYNDPQQNLGKLWWDLKGHYQRLNPPGATDRPDYAAKVHVLTAPVYYQSYLLGELFAAQVRRHIADKVLGGVDPLKGCFLDQPKVGDYLRDKIYGPGNTWSWNDLTKRATGEPLSPRCFVEQFAH